MRKFTNLVLLCLAMSMALTSCVSKKKFTDLMNDKDSIANMLAESQAKVKELEEKMATLESDLNASKEDVAALSAEIESAKADLATAQKKAAEAEKAKAKVASLETSIKGVFAPYANSGLKVVERDNRLYVVMDEPIQFKSGSARIQKNYRDHIASLAEILKNNPKINIQVEGHSDNAKFVSGVSGDNWNLSLQRAMSAVRLLMKNDVSPNQLSAVGRGEYAPVSSGDPSSADARAKNRRIEFVIVPAISSVYGVTP